MSPKAVQVAEELYHPSCAPEGEQTEVEIEDTDVEQSCGECNLLLSDNPDTSDEPAEDEPEGLKDSNNPEGISA